MSRGFVFECSSNNCTRGPSLLNRRKSLPDDNAFEKSPPVGLNRDHGFSSLDCFEPLGISVTEGAKNGKAAISPEMAIRLDKAFGGGAETWLRLQAAYDLAKAQKYPDKINVQRVV